MAGLKNRSENKAFQSVEHIEKYITSISVSNFKTNIPRVNLRRIKLNKFQNLFTDFESKSIAQLYLDKIFLESNLPSGKTGSEIAFEEININPLRKKQAEDEKPPLIEVEEKAVANEPVLKSKIAENKKDITFNLEAQIVQEDESVLLSPTFPSAPKTQDDLVSSSGEQAAFIWPPNLEKKIIKKTKPKKLKKRPYFLSGEGKPLKQPEEKPKITEPRAGDIAAFPWALTGNGNPTAEEMFKGGLELELLDTPKKTEVKEPIEQKTEVPFSGAVTYKALFPNVPFESLPENIINDTLKNTGWFSKLLDKFNN